MLIVIVLLGGAPLVACTATDEPASSAIRAEAVMAARQCGRTLGIAARCNLVLDDHDYSVVRFAVLQGLSSRFAAVSSGDELAEAVDLAALDRITSIGACQMPGADLRRIERAVRSEVAECTSLEAEAAGE